MKKLFLILLALCFISVNNVSPQGLLNKVKKAVTKQITGNNNSGNANSQAKTEPEPNCACNDAKKELDLQNDKFVIPYNEISISILDDGSILVYDRMSGKYYISKDGIIDGPYEPDDPKVKNFQQAAGDAAANTDDNSQDKDSWLIKYPKWIFRSGEKYVIKFGGKTYGPYALINDFAVPRTKDKFAAMVTENVVASEADGKKMEEAMNNAKTDQERMELATKFSQQMAKNIMDGGGAASITPKLITNVPGAKYDQMEWMGAKLNGSVKYDEIVVISQTKVINLQGKTLFTFSDYSESSTPIFISSGNTKYARYNYGSLVFNDKTTLSGLFNPCLTQSGGNTWLTYMYYSPSKNAIMQCQIPF